MGAITPKPKRDEKDLDQFIRAGGDVPSEKEVQNSSKEESVMKPIKFFLPSEIINEIDSLLKSTSIHKPRTVWIREAIMEKLQRERTQ